MSSLRLLCAFLTIVSLPVLNSSAVSSSAAGEYDKHFSALSNLSVAVAQAMPADRYDFRPHPESMTFAQLMAHIATTNCQFCAGLKVSASQCTVFGAASESISAAADRVARAGISRVIDIPFAV